MLGTGSEPQTADQPEVGYTGARFASAAVRRRWQADPPPPPEKPALAPLDPPPTVASPAEQNPGGPFAPPEDPATFVRPYVQTGGRTKSRSDLAMETLVTARAPATDKSWPVNPEYRTVIRLCAVPRSIAEVAALANLPVGVARVVVSDLAELSLLTVHDTPSPYAATTVADLALMQRVLAGLRRL